jgi:predicted nucleic acid-binding protein
VIVVDSSVWIAFFRALDTAATQKLKYLGLEFDLLVGDIVLLEVLRGTRDAEDARKVHDRLSRFELVPMLGVAIAIKAAENYRTLRKLGFTIHKSPDLIIGTYCIEHDYSLLHDDRDFEPMREHLGLRVM